MSINSFTYNGVSSETLGLYVGGQQTFGSPQRDVTKVSIPGRNGDLVRDNGRFLNAEIAYNVVAMSDFKNKAKSVRNWLMSAKGYQRLEDTYHPEHYRMARVADTVDFETGAFNATGKAKVIFDCMPQRFLKTGETPVSCDPVSYEESGDLVTFNALGEFPFTKAEVSLSPIQSGSGDPSPTNVRPISGHAGATLYRTGKNLAKMTYGNQVPSLSTGQMVSGNGWSSPFIPVDNAKAYTTSVQKSVGHYALFYGANKEYLGFLNWSAGTHSYNIAGYANWSQTKFVKLRTNTNTDPESQLEEGSTATAYEPFGNQYPVTFPQTVYGGTFDWASGKLKVTMANIASYNGETIGEPWLSSMDAYVAGATPTTGAQVVHTITPTETTITPAQVQTLLGLNNVWADNGPVELEYSRPAYITNPTMFDAKPLIRVNGSGTCTVTVGNQIIILTDVSGYIDIDCETMNCYNGVVNCNSKVTLGTQGFPTLPPGDTWISFGGGTTSVVITPRWWEL